MAGHEHSEAIVDSNEMSAEAPRGSIEDHKRTYEAFLSLTKWTIVFIALLLIGMAVFLV